MKCPVCKKSIPDETLKCPYCNARTGLVCKNCSTVNSILDLKCKKCGTEILKTCPNCNSVNLPQATECRKCKFSFQKPIIEDGEFIIKQNLLSQRSAKNIIVKGINSNDKKIFSISGKKGSGKSIVLKSIMQDLKEYSWLYGKCTPLTQLTPGGLIQDILLNLFNLPNCCLKNPEFIKIASEFFKNEFPFLNNFEIVDLINFLYPDKEGTFEEIGNRKNQTFEILNKLFDKLITGDKFVIVADNFEFIDGFSYEFLTRLLKRDNIWQNLKLILIYNEPKPAKGYFYFQTDKNIYLDTSIAPLHFKQINMLVQAKNKKIEDFPQVSDAELKEIYKISNGNPSFISNALWLKYESELCGQEFILSDAFRGILENRLALLSHLNPTAYEILLCAAIIGDKINLNLLRELYEESQFKSAIAYLKKMDYINPINEIYFEFSSIHLWETIIKTAKNDKKYKEINEKIMNHLSGLTLSSNAIFGVISQNLKQHQISFEIWTKTTKLAAYIGDLNLYAISQKQSLALINEFDDSDTLKIRYNISERLGKLLSNSNPQEAMEYLPDAISNALAIGDSPKGIELLAYMSSCCRKTGNYFGEVECVDTVLEKVAPENTLDIALLKTSKLNALLNIGNCGQIINLVDNEIMPVIDKYFIKKQKTNDPKLQFMFETMMRTYLILANALVMQGNDRSFEILTILFDIIDRNNIEDELFICKCKLTLAFANTMKGNFEGSEQMLSEILELYRENVMDNETILRWNFINIINNFFRKKYVKIQEDLFQVVTFANNNGDNFTKNILKTLLGKVFKDNENSKQAMEIYNEQIEYFAKEKMAVGALLTWLLIADAAIITDGPQNALEIAQQALEVAQNPKINNYFFIALFKMVIAKCSITISDFETAKMHIESAIILARKYNMKDILSRLYLLYGKYFQEIGLNNSPKQIEYLQAAEKLYDQAKKIIEQTKNRYVYKDLKKSQSVLSSFCKLHSIEI